MQIHPLVDQISVSPQIQLEDLSALAAAGYRSVINNRPDGEAPDQPASATLAAAAAVHGLDYRFVPVVPGRFDDATVEAMTCALQELPRPVLAFCRTGTRSSSLWALQAARHSDVDTLLDVASEAGYDLSGLMPLLQRVRS
jgi:sulfide:quinone oxidoreductase